VHPHGTEDVSQSRCKLILDTLTSVNQQWDDESLDLLSKGWYRFGYYEAPGSDEDHAERSDAIAWMINYYDHFRPYVADPTPYEEGQPISTKTCDTRSEQLKDSRHKEIYMVERRLLLDGIQGAFVSKLGKLTTHGDRQAYEMASRGYRNAYFYHTDILERKDGDDVDEAIMEGIDIPTSQSLQCASDHLPQGFPDNPNVLMGMNAPYTKTSLYDYPNDPYNSVQHIRDSTEGEVYTSHPDLLLILWDITRKAVGKTYKGAFKLMDDAYIRAAGIQIKFDTLWDYHTSHAQRAHEYVANRMEDDVRDLKVEDLTKVPYGKQEQTFATLAWVIAYVPLFFQQALTRVVHKADRNAIATGYITQVIEVAMDIAKKGIIHLHEGHKRGSNGVHLFKIDHNWDDPSRALPTSRSFIRRSDPLQFPDLIPPGKRTHLHGRWVHFQGESRPKWVDYQPATLEGMLDLAPNLSMHDDHWKGRTIPGTEVELDSGEQAADFISTFRTWKGLQTDSDVPAGTLPRQKFVNDTTLLAQPTYKAPHTPLRFAEPFAQPDMDRIDVGAELQTDPYYVTQSQSLSMSVAEMDRLLKKSVGRVADKSFARIPPRPDQNNASVNTTGTFPDVTGIPFTISKSPI